MIKLLSTELESHLYSINQQLKLGSDPSLYDTERAKIILFMYANQSLWFKIALYYHSGAQESVVSSGFGSPDSPRWSKKTGAIPTMPVFDRLIEDVSSTRGGQMFFAHLHIPHYPYSVNSQCQVRRPVLEWPNRHYDSINAETGQTNSPESRLTAYEGSIGQIRCAMRKLDKLFAAMKERGTFDDAVIIIHGDHGSRIVLTEPRQKFQRRLTSQDYHDAFSTLYVVKSPAIEPGYDRRLLALPDLLEGTASGSWNDPPILTGKEKATVFLRGGGKNDFLEVPLPEIATGKNLR